jgi:ribosomal protein L28
LTTSAPTHLHGAAGASPLVLQYFPVRFMLDSRNNLEKPKKKIRFIQNRAKEGLFGGRHIQSGHTISHSHQKTKRWFKPNVQKATLRSDILDRSFRINVTTRMLKTLDKLGGLDNYLFKEKSKKLGPDDGFGKRTRKEIMNKIKETAIQNGEDPVIAYKRRRFPNAPVIFEELKLQRKQQQQAQTA